MDKVSAVSYKYNM